jgi:hypothetical protein
MQLMNKHKVHDFKGMNSITSTAGISTHHAHGESTMSLFNPECFKKRDDHSLDSLPKEESDKEEKDEDEEVIRHAKPKKMKDLMPKVVKGNYDDMNFSDVDSLKAVSIGSDEKRRRKCIYQNNLNVMQQKREFSHMRRLCRNLIKESNCLNAQEFVTDKL